MFTAAFGQEGKAQKDCPKPQPATDEKFSPGQVWSYQTRPGEEKSTLTVLKIEIFPESKIKVVHIRVDGFHFHNCTGGARPDNQEHAPFDRNALNKSVTKLLRIEKEVPPFGDGYAQWRSDCGGVYTISVAEMLDVNETTFNEGLGCKIEKPSQSTTGASR